MLNDKGKIIAFQPGPFRTSRDARAEIDKVVQFFREQKENQEGFYLLENVLLRPRHNVGTNELQAELLLADIDYSNMVKPVAINPYSFCVTMVFPGWSKKFVQAEFRTYVERLIRSEIPAHILPEIYWLDHAVFEEFEDAFLLWLQVNTLFHQPEPETTAREWDEATAALTLILNKIRSGIEND